MRTTPASPRSLPVVVALLLLSGACGMPDVNAAGTSSQDDSTARDRTPARDGDDSEDADAAADAAGREDEIGEDEIGEADSEEPSRDRAAAAPDADEKSAGGTDTTDETRPAACTDADTRLPPELPEGVERVEESGGDLDGDGRADRVLTFAIDGGDRTTFFLRVVTASGYVVEASLDEADRMAPVRPLGTSAIGDDREVVFVVERTGASGPAVSLWALHEFDDHPCALGRVTIPDPTVPPVFPVGGTVGAAAGLACDDADGDGTAELVVTSAERTPEETYAWTRTAWRWPGAGELQSVGEESGTVDDPEQLHPGLDCPGVEPP